MIINVMPRYRVTLAFSTPIHSNPTPGGSVGVKSNIASKISSVGMTSLKLEISDSSVITMIALPGVCKFNYC